MTIYTQQLSGQKFFDIMGEAKSVLYDGLNTDAKYISIDLRCAHGQHRSVACLEVIAHICRSMGLVVITEHLTARLCGCPSQCDRQPTTEHAVLFAADGITAFSVASRVWDAS